MQNAKPQNVKWDFEQYWLWNHLGSDFDDVEWVLVDFAGVVIAYAAYTFNILDLVFYILRLKTETIPNCWGQSILS